MIEQQFAVMTVESGKIRIEKIYGGSQCRVDSVHICVEVDREGVVVQTQCPVQDPGKVRLRRTLKAAPTGFRSQLPAWIDKRPGARVAKTLVERLRGIDFGRGQTVGSVGPLALQDRRIEVAFAWIRQELIRRQAAIAADACGEHGAVQHRELGCRNHGTRCRVSGLEVEYESSVEMCAIVSRRASENPIVVVRKNFRFFKRLMTAGGAAGEV